MFLFSECTDSDSNPGRLGGKHECYQKAMLPYTQKHHEKSYLKENLKRNIDLIMENILDDLANAC